jgi:hypothetical protein
MRRDPGILGAGIAMAVGLLAAGPVSAGGNGAPAHDASTGVTPAGFTAPLEVVTGHFEELSEVVDSTNHLHIAATGRHGLWYLTDRGGSWSRSRILLDVPDQSWSEPSIALDTNDRVYISVAQNACDGCTPGSTTGIYYLTDKGRTRGTFPAAATKIAPPRSGEGTIKVDSGHIFLSYVKPCCQPGPLPKVLVRTDATGSWTTTQVSPHGDRPSLRIGSDGRPRIAFNKAGGIFYATASSPAGSFAKEHVPGTVSADDVARLALGAGNRPHLVWFHERLSGTAVRYAARGAGGWSTPSEIEHDAGFGATAFDLDTLERPNVAIGRTHIRNWVLSGGIWHKTPVANELDVRSLAERRASNGHVVIAWTDNGGGIWISRY